MEAQTPPDQAFTVGWICALQRECEAAMKMLDSQYEIKKGHGHDNNYYILGRIGPHNVVITCLPMGWIGSNSAAVVATRMMSLFQNVKVSLMVGIGGGIPDKQNDIRLGDVVVSKPTGEHGGVIQYDLGKLTPDGFTRIGSLNAPPEKLGALDFMPQHGAALSKSSLVEYPGAENDVLYDSGYIHVGGDTCELCDKRQVVKRGPGKRQSGPRVFYGTIASGNLVITDAEKRRILIEKYGVLCCEMEAAGLMNSSFPCLVIRGISDYADSHKNDEWQDYAAASAAQFAKDFLNKVPRRVIENLPSIQGGNANSPSTGGTNAGSEAQIKVIADGLGQLVGVSNTLVGLVKGITTPRPPVASHEERCWLGVVRTCRVVQARAMAGVEDGKNLFDKELEEVMRDVMNLPLRLAHWWHNEGYRSRVQNFSDKWNLGMRWATASQRLDSTQGGGDLLSRMKRSVVVIWEHHNREDDMIKMEWMETLIAMFEFVTSSPSPSGSKTIL
ncbi:hypothetical protein TWF281_004609 [Arthrobotrys megalospora]